MIHILGINGMLGNCVYSYLNRQYDCKGYTRSEFDVLEDIVRLDKLNVCENDVVVNCIGVIKPQIEKIGETNSFIINSYFPNVLADHCENKKAKLIHITTDCVYSGKTGNYDENSLSDQFDTYGLSKKLGEPNNCCVIRTSIIGEEKHTKRSLVEWIKSNSGKEIKGFTDHLWNGVTCLELSKIIEKIIHQNLFWSGVRHIYSPNSVSKFELLNLINQVYDLDIKIAPVTSGSYCDRTLCSVHYTSSELCSKEIKEQIDEMKKHDS
tara:strand:- start:1605 stop:2402 length:798 start_codon:yes stop_codon:yes gene_type:complete